MTIFVEYYRSVGKSKEGSMYLEIFTPRASAIDWLTKAEVYDLIASLKFQMNIAGWIESYEE